MEDISKSLLSTSALAIAVFGSWMVRVMLKDKKASLKLPQSSSSTVTTVASNDKHSVISKDGSSWLFFAVSKGMVSSDNQADLPSRTLSVDDCVEFARDNSCGAIVTFCGTIRESSGDKIVTHLEYKADESKAFKELESICDNIRKQWPQVKKIAIGHVIGSCPVGGISISIAISSVHRKQGLDAAQFIVEEIKNTSIWKREIYKGSSSDNFSSTWKHS